MMPKKPSILHADIDVADFAVGFVVMVQISELVPSIIGS